MAGSPILDLEQSPPEPPSNRRIRLLGLAAGAAIGLTLAVFTSPPPPWQVFLILPALYIAIAVHELGHLLAGWSVGMKPGGLVIGGFSIMKSGNQHVFRFDYRRIFSGGMALSLTTRDQFSPNQFAWMVAGGPIASVVLTILCGAVSVLKSDYSGGWTNVLFWMAVLTVGSLIPGSSGINRTDGAKLWQLLRYPERTYSWIALIALQSEERRGVRPRDWDPELVERVLATGSGAREYPYSELLMFYRQMDLHDELAAVVHLENALSTSGIVERFCVSVASWRPLPRVLFYETIPLMRELGWSVQGNCADQKQRQPLRPPSPPAKGALKTLTDTRN